MSAQKRLATLILLMLSMALRADEWIYSYEGDVLPYPDAGWWWGDCQGACQQSLQKGHFVLRWDAGHIVGYGYIFARPGTPPPPAPPFWIEWRFRSNHRLTNDQGCDGIFGFQYINLSTYLAMFGDAVVSNDGGTVISGLSPDFRTYRFETADGSSGCFYVDGSLFICATGLAYHDTDVVYMSGHGGCQASQLPTFNEWDFVRFGRITYGEQIIASDPPGGFVDARLHAPLSHFTVVYDQPNYIHVDEVSVNVKGTERSRDQRIKSPLAAARSTEPTAASNIPQVTATRRRDNGPPDEVEVVLDRPIPYNATTRFTFNDGVAENVVEFTFAPGDTDGDGDADLADFSSLANCFSEFPLTSGPCLALDADRSGVVDGADYAAFITHFEP